MQVGRLMRRRGGQGSNRARIMVEALEDRFCLSQMVTGFDGDGIAFTLTLSGPGRVLVDKFVPAGVDPANPPLPVGVQATPGNPDQTLLNSLTNIDKITLVGTTADSVLTGSVNSPNHEVLFEQLIQDSSSISTGAVRLNGFSLARTNTATTPGSGTSPATFSEEPNISFPNGIGTLKFDNIQLNDPVSNAQLTSTNQTSIATVDITAARNKTTIDLQQIDVGPRVLLQFNVNGANGELNIFHAQSINGHREVSSTAAGANPNNVFEGVTQLIVTPVSETEIGAQTSNAGFGTVNRISIDQGAHNFQVEAASINHVTVGGSFTGDLIDAPVTSSSFGGTQLQPVNLIDPATGGAPDAPALSTAVIHGVDEIKGDVRVGTNVQQARISSRVVGDVNIRGTFTDSMLRTESFFRSVTIGGDISGSEILAGLVERDAGGTNPMRGQWVQNGKINRLSTAGNITDSVIAASYDPEDDVFGNADDDPLSGGSISGNLQNQPQAGGPTAIHGYSTDRNGVFSRGGLGATSSNRSSSTDTTSSSGAAASPSGHDHAGSKNGHGAKPSGHSSQGQHAASSAQHTDTKSLARKS